MKRCLGKFFPSKILRIQGMLLYLQSENGVLAQLVERLNGIQKVRSSILLCSTKIPLRVV